MFDIEKLVYIRRLHGIAQSELCARLNVSKPYISMIENKKQHMPKNLYDKWVKALYGEYDYRESEE